jgi:hypothetical protein
MKIERYDHIKDEDILNYLADKQGEWTCLWNGYFKGKDDSVTDVYYAMPLGTSERVALAKMRSMHRRGLVAGCTCGCRGDFEITDYGLSKINKSRTVRYNGYDSLPPNESSTTVRDLELWAQNELRVDYRTASLVCDKSRIDTPEKAEFVQDIYKQKLEYALKCWTSRIIPNKGINQE